MASDHALPAEHSPYLDDYELNVDDVFGSCLPGTTGGDVEDHSITIGCGYASPNLRASEEMDGIEPSTNQTVDMKAYKDFEPSNACTAPVPASHSPYLPHQNVFSGSSRSIQDTAASTAIGVWAEPLPSTNVHQPGATQGYGRQDERQIGAQLDPTREHSYGYDIARAPSPYAPDNMGSISTLWAEPGVRAHDQYTEHIDPAMTLNYHSDTSPHPPPWNNLDWSIIQDARPVEPVCGCWGTSSRVPAATHSSASTLPWTRTSRSTSDLGGFDLYESEDSVPASLTTGSQQPLWYCEHGNPIKYFRSESDLGYGDAYGASAPSDYLESQYLAAGQDPSIQNPHTHLYVPLNTNITAREPLPISEASVQDPDVLRCPHPGCGNTYTGRHRRGNLGRHIRLKHRQGETIYRCEANGCRKVFLRQDARLKHHRRRHPELNLPDPVARA